VKLLIIIYLNSILVLYFKDGTFPQYSRSLIEDNVINPIPVDWFQLLDTTVNYDISPDY
jgi:hypothetical protein